MHILIITPRLPFPLTDGGLLAMNYFLEGYIKAGIKLSLVSLDKTNRTGNTKHLPEVFQKLEVFEIVNVAGENSKNEEYYNILPIPKSYNIGRYNFPRLHKTLERIFSENTFDFVQLEGLFLVPYVKTIRNFSKSKIILRSHNVEYKLWERLLNQEKNFLKKVFCKIMAFRLKNYEIQHINKVDIILPISDIDRKFYEKHTFVKVFTQTFGINLDNVNYITEINTENLKMYHLGSMSYLPNIGAVQNLIENIMPAIGLSHPNHKLYLAGSNMSNELLNINYPNVEVVGEVEDTKSFEQDKQILLVPLLSGMGVKIKILQGMAAGKAIVTTPIGAEGIACEHKKHLLIANNTEEFINYTKYLLDFPDEIVRIAKNAQQNIYENYNRTQQISNLIVFLKNNLLEIQK